MRDQPKAGTVRATTSYLKKGRCQVKMCTDTSFALSVCPPLQHRLDELARQNHKQQRLRRSRPVRPESCIPTHRMYNLRRCVVRGMQCKDGSLTNRRQSDGMQFSPLHGHLGMHECWCNAKMRRVAHDYSIKRMC